jgi:hypothetical protein
MVSGVTSTNASANGWSAMSQLRQALFRRLDTNGDGVIDKKEIMAAMSAGRKHITGSSKSSPTLDQAFTKADTNGDGVISPSEFAAALSSGTAAGLFSISTSSLVSLLSPASSTTSASGTAAAQNRSTASLLKNYLAQVGQMAKQGYTTTV